MTKHDIALLCEMTPPYYQRILDGSANPTLHVICRIATNLKVPMALILKT